MALLSATGIVLATRAFRDWVWTDLAACSVFLGLALATKHSAPVVLLSVAIIGAWLAFARPITQDGDGRWKRLVKIGAVLAEALAILWGFYLFRYAETRTGEQAFNRALADKIKDVETPSYHAVLTVMAATHVVPRAYIWGFADTVHAGMEGRPYQQMFFGRLYLRKAPRYFFPSMIAVKLPIGLGALGLLGLVVFFAGRLPSEWDFPAGVIFAACILFLLVLANGATYAGIRHAMPVVALFSIFAGLFVERAIAWNSRSLKAVVLLAYVVAVVSAVPVLRPWEYFNEFVGGTENAYKYFTDEGVDLGQRSKEIAVYYRKYLKPAGELPDVQYSTSLQELEGRDIDYLGRNMERDLPRLSQPMRTGTIFACPIYLMPGSFWDKPALREATPAARLGNAIVYQGTFSLPGNAASDLYGYGIHDLFAGTPDEVAAEKKFRTSAELDPTAYFVHIELGNLLLKRGAKEEALHFYKEALRFAPADPQTRRPIERQIQRVTSEPIDGISPLRDPFLE